MDKQVQQMESLQRAKNGDSLLNYPNIINGFIAKGISASDIIPRENVFTYNAWKALGRQVNKGEHGVKVVTWIDATDKDTGLPTKLCRSLALFSMYRKLHLFSKQ
jgi:antirestriction protein ArdC